MIPYDDLVVALATWRARQGLPVAQLSGALTPPPEPPRQVTFSGPPITPPITAPPRAAAPPPLAQPEPGDSLGDSIDAALLEDGQLDESQLDNEGADFAMAFGGGLAAEGESTMIGGAPGPGADPDDLPPPPRGRNDW